MTHKHSPEIEKVLEGCGNPEYNLRTGNVSINCGDDLGGNYGEYYLCPSCKSFLRGIILAQEKEIEFLEDKFIILDTPDNDELDAGIVRNDINERVNQLKESNEDLKRRLE